MLGEEGFVPTTLFIAAINAENIEFRPLLNERRCPKLKPGSR